MGKEGAMAGGPVEDPGRISFVRFYFLVYAPVSVFAFEIWLLFFLSIPAIDLTRTPSCHMNNE